MAAPVAAEINAQSITLQWTLPTALNGELDRFELLVQSASAAAQLIYSGPATTFTATALLPATAYNYSVSVYNKQVSTPATSAVVPVVTRESSKLDHACTYFLQLMFSFPF